MTTKIFVAIRNLEMYKCIEFHTSVPKLQGDIQRSNNLYLIKALFVVPVHVLNCTIDNTVVDLTQSGYPASGEINHCNPRAREYTNIRRSL